MTTYYVDSAATGTGTGLSEANAFTTIDAAMNIMATAGAGPHTVNVKASGTYDETANIDTAGGLTGAITFEGYTTTPGDNGKVTWTSSSGSALTDTPSQSYYVFKNFKFNSCAGVGISVASTFKFLNCEISNNSSHGVTCSSQCTFVNCDIFSNTFEGIQASSGIIKILGCKIYGQRKGWDANNGQDGLAYKSVFYNHTSGQTPLFDLGLGCCVIGCTVDGDATTNDLMNFVSGQWPGAIIDNILYDGNYALDCTGTGAEEFASFVGYNLVNSNATGDYNVTANAIPEIGYGDVTSAPAFTDEAGDDYTLGASSPAIDAGLMPGGIT